MTNGIHPDETRNTRYTWILALALVILGSAIAWLLLGQPPVLVGIDDANITQVYGRNIADGHGYVYTPGYERVEGSTSLLWTLINAAAFHASPRPEPLLLIVCGALTLGAIYLSLHLFVSLSRAANVTQRSALVIYSVYLASIPEFYAWNVLTMMDVALWCFVFIAYVHVIVGRIRNGAGSTTGATVLAALTGSNEEVQFEARAAKVR